MRWLTEMVSKEIKPDLVAYTALIHCSAKRGNVEEATRHWKGSRVSLRGRWFERMGSNDLRGDCVTYTTLINACAKGSDATAARAWLQRLVEP